jgi:hypothetical protein
VTCCRAPSVMMWSAGECPVADLPLTRAVASGELTIESRPAYEWARVLGELLVVFRGAV